MEAGGRLTTSFMVLTFKISFFRQAVIDVVVWMLAFVSRSTGKTRTLGQKGRGSMNE
jgi:hypothetical protein